MHRSWNGERIGVLLVLVACCTGGCGGSSATGEDAGGGGGTGGGNDASTEAAAGFTLGDLPPCIVNLFTGCGLPDGCGVNGCTGSATCTVYEQPITSPYSDNVCYSNGVKLLWSGTSTGAGTTVKLGSAGTTCFTVDYTSDPTGTTSFKNAAGTTVATLKGTTTASTVTCDGQTYPVTGQNDFTIIFGGNAGINCSAGACQ